MNRLRFRSGQVQLIKVPVNSETVIEAGDLVWLDTDDAKPASGFAWTTNLATTQGNFAAKFLGIAHQQSAAGNADPISVDISPGSVYEFDCPSTNYVIGDAVGPDELSSKLMNQQVEKAALPANAIARTTESATAATTLRISFASAYHTASSNINASIG